MRVKELFKEDGSLSINDINMGMAKISKMINNRCKHAILNSNGDFISDFEYEIVQPYSEGVAAVSKNMIIRSRMTGENILRGRFGLIDCEGRTKVDLMYEELGQCSEGLIMARLNNRYGYIDCEGNIKIPFIYEEARAFSDGLAAVKLGGKYGFIDKNNKLVIGFRYFWTHDFSDNVCFVQKENTSDNENLYYINKKGRIEVRIERNKLGRFIMPGSYCEGSMIVNNNTIVDKNSEIINKFKPTYRLSEFKNNISKVHNLNNDRYGFVDTEGVFVIPCKYSKCIATSANDDSVKLIGVRNIDNRWGLVDYQDKNVVGFDYDNIIGYSKGRILVSKNNITLSINI